MKDYSALQKEKKVERFFRASTEPLGLEYIAAFLRANSNFDLEVEIVDFDVLRFSFRQVQNFLCKSKASIVGISCDFAPITPYALEIARMVKEQTNALCVVGGVHATFIAREILKSTFVDMVVLYEGEKAFLEIVNNLHSGKLFQTKGIAYKNGMETIINKPAHIINDLDRLPYPARDLLPLEKYIDKFGLLYVASSRGCPYSCIHCACSAFSKGNFRTRSAENIMDEICLLCDAYSPPHISFTDDLFTLDCEKVLTFCRLLKERAVDITWDCYARIDTVTGSLMETMRNAGCIKIKFGIESGSQEVLDILRRGYTLQKARKTISTANKIGFKEVRTCFILGIPGETLDTMQRTLEFACELKPDSVEFVIAMPFPGTKMADIMQNKNMILTKDWKLYRHGYVVIDPLFCTPRQLIEIQKKAYDKFYFRKEYIDTQFKRGKTAKEIVGYLSSWLFEIRQIGRDDIEG